MNGMDFPMEELDAVFITHYHNDHYADLGEVMEMSWVLGRRIILPVYGPTGIAQIVDGFRSAYELETSYRTAHHGEEIMPPEWSPSEPVECTPPVDDSAIVVYDRMGSRSRRFGVAIPPSNPMLAIASNMRGWSSFYPGIPYAPARCWNTAGTLIYSSQK